MHKCFFASAVFLMLTLSACGGGSAQVPPPNPTPSSVFTPENTFSGPIPTGAQTLDKDTFEQKIKGGELILVGDKTVRDGRAAALAKLAQDKAVLEGIPANLRGAPVLDLLSRVSSGANPLLEPTQNVGSKKVLLLSLASQMNQAARTFSQGQSPENALMLYRSSYEATANSSSSTLPTPDSLTGKSLADIRLAQARLERYLGELSDIDGAKALSSGADDGTFSSQSLDPNPGTGTGGDGDTACTHTASGIYGNFYWPLKNFVSSVKQQAQRGTCWAFAAVGALESRERVVSGLNPNMSEQFLVNKEKLEWNRDDASDGDDSATALGNLLTHSFTLPLEPAWVYNPANSRPYPAYTDACKNYGGTCSESSHESPKGCVNLPFLGNFCGYFPVASGQGVFLGNTTFTVYAPSSSDYPWSSASVRSLLANGHALLASFGVRRGFQEPDANGFVTNFDDTHQVYDDKGNLTYGAGDEGGHEVLIVGYVSNKKLFGKLPSAPQGAGGGYYILKNSWGCAADGGYYYVPSDYVKKYFTLQALDLPKLRSTAWNAANGNSVKQEPTVSIDQPFKSPVAGSIQINPEGYLDFAKPIVLSASATDLQDGANCCSSTFSWTSQKKGTLGTGKSITANLSGLSEDHITVTGKDSDGNSSSATLWISDAYPLVNILSPPSPLEGQTLETAKNYSFGVEVKKFGISEGYDCSSVVWKTSVTADGTRTGCAPSYTFSSAGDRTLTATYNTSGRAPVSDTLSVKVVKPAPSGPPAVALAVKNRTGNLQPNTVVGWTFSDPGGPGEADYSKYTYTWELEYDGVKKTINPKNFLGRANEKLIVPGDVFTIPDCTRGGVGKTLTVSLSITDPEGLTGTGSVRYLLEFSPCIG